MEKNDKVARAAVGVCLVTIAAVAAAAGCLADATDPTAIARSLAATSPTTSAPPVPDSRPLVATSAVPLVPPPPAPIVEAAKRSSEPPPASTTVAISRDAESLIAPTAEQAFAAPEQLTLDRLSTSSNRDAIEFVMLGRADFALIGGQLSARDLHAGLRQSRVGVELFALTVAKESAIRSLSRTQVRQVFTGEVTHWHQFGLEGDAIVAVVPSDPALCNHAAEALIPGDSFASTCVRVASERHVADQLLRNKGAVGIVRLTQAPLEGDMKLLMIDWCAPSLETYGFGTYPFGKPLHLVSNGQPTGAAKHLLDFAASAAGREVLGRALLMP